MSERVWVVEVHIDDMLSSMCVLGVAGTGQAAKQIADARCCASVLARRVWRHPRPWVWEMRWSRAKNAALVARATLHSIRC